MAKVRSPLDVLDRKKIAEDCPTWLPEGVVAVLGDHRGRDHWHDLRVSPDGKWIMGVGHGGVYVWDAATLRGHKAFFKGRCGAWSRDGKLLAVGGLDDTAWLYDVADGEFREQAALVGKKRPPPTSPEQLRKLAPEEFKELPLEKLKLVVMDPREKYSRDIRWPVIDIGLTEDGRALIALNEECILRVWDLTGKEPKERVAFDGLLLGQGGGMILPGTQRLLCEISPSKRQQLGMELWDLSGDQPRREGFISGCWLPAVVTPDGRTLAAKPFGVGAIQLWDIGGKEPKPLRLLPGEVTSRLSSPAFTADGNVLMYGVEKAFRQVPINDAGRKQLGLAKDSPYLDSPVGLAAHQFQVFPDGKTLAVEDDKAIRLWDMVKKQAKFPAPRGHLGPVVAGVFTPDGKTLITAAQEWTIRLWRLEKGRWQERQVLRRLQRHLMDHRPFSGRQIPSGDRWS